jgi:hypothetical protein
MKTYCQTLRLSSDERAALIVIAAMDRGREDPSWTVLESQKLQTEKLRLWGVSRCHAQMEAEKG